MIRAIYIAKEEGTPIYWEVYDKSMEKYSDMLPTFLSALISLGEELLDVPERLDLHSYSITFYRARGETDYWFFIITDHVDTRNSTLRAVKILKDKTLPFIERELGELGLITEDFQKKLSKALGETLKVTNRPLRKWRSGGVRSIVFGLISTLVAYNLLSSIVFPLLNSIGLLYTNVLFSLAVLGITTLSSIIGGIACGVPKEASFSAWLGILIMSILIFPNMVLRYGLGAAIAIFMYSGIGLGGFAATLAYLAGLYYDNQFVK